MAHRYLLPVHVQAGKMDVCAVSYAHVHSSCVTEALGVGVFTHTDLGIQCISMDKHRELGIEKRAALLSICI